jgi:hypothetical protein
MKNQTKSSRLLTAAFAGLIIGAPLSLASCGGKADAQKKEANGCNGPNGCGADAKNDKNRCSGPNGCDGHGTKK